jgi:uncharacterized membrane protein YqjE
MKCAEPGQKKCAEPGQKRTARPQGQSQLSSHSMIEETGSVPSNNSRIPESPVMPDRTHKGNWMEAICGLVESRVSIISIESKDALNSALAKFIPLAVCLFCVLAAWFLAVATAIGCLAATTEWKWYQITFAIAGLHLVIALVALLIAKKSKPAPFPVTRSEFEKDREWLIQLKNRND